MTNVLIFAPIEILFVGLIWMAVVVWNDAFKSFEELGRQRQIILRAAEKTLKDKDDA